MTLSFLWSAITDSVKKTMRAWRSVMAVVLLSLVIVAGCDVRPFSEFSGDDNGSEENGDGTGSGGTSDEDEDEDMEGEDEDEDMEGEDEDEDMEGEDEDMRTSAMLPSIASGDENGGDDKEEVPGDTTHLQLTATPAAIETTVNVKRTIDIDVVNPEAGRTYTYTITTNPTNGTSDMNNNAGVLTYTSDIAIENDSLEVTVTDDGTPPRSGTIEIDITVNPN